MSLSIIEFIDQKISEFCPDTSLYDVSPFNLFDFRDCFIMELIKMPTTKKNLDIRYGRVAAKIPMTLGCGIVGV